jgi:uncharacterized protein
MKKADRRHNVNAPWRVLHYFRTVPSRVCVLLVRFYQLTLSPAKTVLLGPAGHCLFEPSCSQYAMEALKIHGAISGSWLAAKRVCRCHPWGDFGADPVPAAKSKAQSPKSKVPSAELRVSNVGFL